MTSYHSVPVCAEDKCNFKGYGKRHTQAILIFCCMVTTACVRGCINIAMIAMTDFTIHQHKIQIFDWDKQIIGIIQSASYCGDLFMQLPAGYLVCKYGGKSFLTLTTAATGLGSFLIPLASRNVGWQGVYGCRFLLGLFSAFIFPCIHTLTGKWAPLSERNRFGIIIYSGVNIAFIISSPISGFIASTHLAWPWIFYFFGTICIFNALAWHLIGANSPAEHTTITTEEKTYIEKSLGDETCNGSIPWRAMITSKPVLALIASQCFLFFCYTIMIVEIPMFCSKALKIPIDKSGLLSSLPYIASFFASILCCVTADYLQNKSIFSLTVIRKLFNSLGSMIAAFCLTCLVFVPQDHKVLLVFLIMTVIAGDALTGAGILLNHIDLSPNFAGMLMCWALTVADVGSVLAPIISSKIVYNPSDIQLWRKLFIVVAASYTIGNLIFVLYGTAKTQPWNNVREPTNNIDLHECTITRNEEQKPCIENKDDDIEK